MRRAGRSGYRFLSAAVLLAWICLAFSGRADASGLLDSLLYGEPGADFGKGHVYTFPAGQVPLAITPLPEHFSWADYGKKPAVKSQGTLGTCWALTAAEAIESDLLPEISMEFSADHISMQNGFSISQDEGGDYSMIMSYMADLKGPVLESEDPYGDGESPAGLRPAVRVSEMRLLTGMSARRVKSMIYRFGAVQSSLCMDRERMDTDKYQTYNEETYAYFDPVTEELNHDILILGWDDRYPRENFRVPPKKDGAWICQNSWGTDFGDDGLFYVSYEDANLLRKGGIAYTDVEPADDSLGVLETDSLGWQARQGYRKSDAFFAGVFESGREQTLSSVGFYSTGPATSYKVYLVPEFSGTGDLNGLVQADTGGMNGQMQVAASAAGAADESGGGHGHGADGENDSAISLGYGWLEHPGFYTIPADKEQLLAAGQKFAVVVFIDTPGAENPVAVETAKDKYTQNVVLEGRESYISPDGISWDRTQSVYGTNVCLKVYTETH